MKHRILWIFSLIFTVALCTVIASYATVTGASEVASSVTFNGQKAIEARLLNLLNHNYVYDDAFDSEEQIVNDSVIALLDMRDSQYPDFIEKNCVSDFVYNMYGVSIGDPSGYNAGFPQMDGYFYIIPRGFTSYSHTIVSVTRNEDGSYTTVSDVTVTPHDGAAQSHTATTLFIRNDRSDFGYNIISSYIE